MHTSTLTIFHAIILASFGLKISGTTTRCIYTFDTQNIISETQILPRCVSPVENLLNGRIRSGVGNGLVFEEGPPFWFNATLATIGQTFAKKYWFSINLAMILGGVAVLTPNDTSQTIFYSGANHLTNALPSAAAFYFQTSVWYEENLFSPRQNLYQSISKVRRIHLRILDNFKNNSTKVTNSKSEIPYKIDSKIWRAWQKDLESSSIPNAHRTVEPEGRGNPEFKINQYAMATVLWGLAALPLIRSESIGIRPNSVTDEEFEGFCHFWAFVGFSLGLEDEYNVCLQPDVRATRVYFERFLNEHLIPRMFHMSYETKALLEQTIKGFGNVVGPIVQFEFILRRILEDVVGIPCPNIIRQMKPMGRIVDTFWRRSLLPAVRSMKSLRSIADLLFNGYVQNLSLHIFGFDGTNKTIVAEKAFTSFIFEN